LKERLVRVRIRYPNYSEHLSMKSWQFGEYLWARFSSNSRIKIDLGEIDRATDEISFLVRDSYLKKALREVDVVLREHLMESEAVVTSENV
jgi:hypothetical protein